MTLNDFTTVYPEATVLDPNKRVNYVHGLVLGVDEFKQEEFYLLEKDRLHNRSLHGSGTVCGLSIEQAGTSAGLEIKVHPGTAICANGQVVQVTRTQCALINDWLAGHAEDVLEQLGSPAAGELSVYLMLCYRECKTDTVPVPTGPCQSLDESTAASRIADDFSLSLELTPPAEMITTASPAPVDEGVLFFRFIELLRSIPVEPGGTLTVEDMQDWVRSLAQGSPALLPEPGSPPLSGAIDPDRLSGLLNAAVLVWVTEIKPCLMSSCTEVVPADPYENCVFLAELNFDITIVAGVPQLTPASQIRIIEQARRYLLDTQSIQMLQTHLLANAAGAGWGAMPVRKRKLLPAMDARPTSGAGYGILNGRIQSMRFNASTGAGRLLFNLPIPDDMDFTETMRFRLVWGYQANIAIEFDWRVGAQFYAAGDPIANVETVDVSVSEPATSHNAILMTGFHDFNAALVLDNSKEFAVIDVSIVNPGSSFSQVHLLQVEIEYTANPAGGIV